MSNSTITLQNVINLARTHVELQPVVDVGGFTNEPALSLCNDVIQELLAQPLDWRFNRAEMPMLATYPFKQDYLFAGACAFTLGNSSNTARGWAIDLTSNNGLTQSGGVVTVKTLETHDFAIGEVVFLNNCQLANGNASAYNATISQTISASNWTGGQTITGSNPAAKTFTFAGVTSETSGALGITDFGWLAGCSMVALSSNATILPTRHPEAVRDLQPYGYSQDPEKIAVVTDLGTGVLKIRFYPVPGTTLWGVNPVYQKRAILKTALTGTTVGDWSPFPDEVSYVYRQGFLARAYRYVNSPRADAEYQKFQAMIGKALGADDRETSDRHLYPEVGIMTSLDSYWVL